MKVFFDLACMSTCCWGLPKPKYQSFITHNRALEGTLNIVLDKGGYWSQKCWKSLIYSDFQFFPLNFITFSPPPPQLHYQHNILNDRNLVNINVNMNFRMSVCILSPFCFNDSNTCSAWPPQVCMAPDLMIIFSSMIWGWSKEDLVLQWKQGHLMIHTKVVHMININY